MIGKGLPFYTSHQNPYPNITDWRLCKSLFFYFSSGFQSGGCCLLILFKEFSIIPRPCSGLEGEHPADCRQDTVKQCLCVD